MSTAAVKSDPNVFFDDLRTSSRRALLLDYDGTVAPFTADRTRAYPDPTIPELLDSIMSTCRTRVALISGRSAREIPPLLGLDPHPEVWGAHGLERLYPDGRYEVKFLTDGASEVLAEAQSWLEAEGLMPLSEIKAGAVAVHWRGLGRRQVEEVRTCAYRALSGLGCRPGVNLFEFNGGLELRAQAANKGDAVRAIISEIADETPIAYLGDDVSDEDAFRKLNGRGLTVLVRQVYRFTAAQMWIRPPEDLVQFLTDWIRACGGDV